MVWGGRGGGDILVSCFRGNDTPQGLDSHALAVIFEIFLVQSIRRTPSHMIRTKHADSGRVACDMDENPPTTVPVHLTNTLQPFQSKPDICRPITRSPDHKISSSILLHPPSPQHTLGGRACNIGSSSCGTHEPTLALPMTEAAYILKSSLAPSSRVLGDPAFCAEEAGNRQGQITDCACCQCVRCWYALAH